MTEDLSSNLFSSLSDSGIHGRIEDLVPLTGGASKEIWKFNLVDSKESTRMIFRRGAQGESSLAIKTADEAKIQEEQKI